MGFHYLIDPDGWLAQYDKNNHADTLSLPAAKTNPSDQSIESFYKTNFPKYVDRTSNQQWNESTDTGMWAPYNSSSIVTDLMNAKKKELVFYQSVDIQDEIADGFNVFAIKGQVFDEDSGDWRTIASIEEEKDTDGNPTGKWIKYSVAANGSKTKIAEFAFDSNTGAWTPDPETDSSPFRAFPPNTDAVIDAEFDLKTLDSQKVRILIDLQTTVEVQYDVQQGEQHLVKTNGDASVSYDGEDPTDIPSPTLPEPAVRITKTVENKTKDRGGYVCIGDSLTYTIVVENIGETVLTNVNVVDELTGDTESKPIHFDSIAAGDIKTTTRDYTVSASDISEGKLVNIASVTATDSNDKPVTGKTYIENELRTSFTATKEWDDKND